MSENGLAGAVALVTGASRGFGRGIATALIKAGAPVLGVARDLGPLEELRAGLGESFTAVPTDAADPVVAGQLIDACRPAILVLNAGAARCRGRSSTTRGSRSAATGSSTLRTCSRAQTPPPSTGGPALTPEQAGQAIVDLTGPGYDQDAYLITAAGLRPLP